MRRVLFLCSVLDVGGAERHWESLLPGLREHGVEPRLVAVKAGGRSFDAIAASGVPTRVLGGRGGLATLASVGQLAAERASRPEALVTWGADAVGLGAVFARLRGIPHLTHWHAGPGVALSRRRTLAYRTAARLGGGALAVTHAQVPELRALGYPPSRIRVARPGVPAPPVRSGQREDARSDLELEAEGFVAVVVARLSREKRLDRFVAGVHRAAGSGGVTGVVVGEGPERAQLEQLAADLNAPVRFVGYSDRPADYMVAANVVCLTSDREALPLTILEGAACARATVSMDVGGVRDVVEDDVTGRVTPAADVDAFADALAALAAAPDRADAMGAAARARWSDRYTYTAMLESYAELLHTVRGPSVGWPETDDA